MNTTYRVIVLGDHNLNNVGKEAATPDMAKMACDNVDRENHRLAIEQLDWYYDFNKKIIQSAFIIDVEDTPGSWLKRDPFGD
jgi:hypothetical protein